MLTPRVRELGTDWKQASGLDSSPASLASAAVNQPPLGPMFPASLMMEAAMREPLGDNAHVRKRLSGASERTRERCPDARVDHLRRIASKYTWPGSNWRPSACKADVIATRPQVPACCLAVLVAIYVSGGVRLCVCWVSGFARGSSFLILTVHIV